MADRLGIDTVIVGGASNHLNLERVFQRWLREWRSSRNKFLHEASFDQANLGEFEPQMMMMMMMMTTTVRVTLAKGKREKRVQ